jgi:hypothetical protein
VAVRKELNIPIRENTANCLRMGKGASRRPKKQIAVETKLMSMLFIIWERISLPVFREGLPFQCTKKCTE